MGRTIELPAVYSDRKRITLADLYLLIGTSRVIGLNIAHSCYARTYDTHPYQARYQRDAVDHLDALAFVREDGSYHTWVSMVASIEVEDE